MNILTDEEILAAITPECVEGDWYLPQTFARVIEAAVQEKLAAQDVEPVGYIVSIDDEPELGHWFSEGPADAEGMSCQKLYTEAQLLAEQKRTAEACAKVCLNLPRKFRSEFSNVSSECAEAIRNGEWSDYL